MSALKNFLENGWIRFDKDPELLSWIDEIRDLSLDLSRDASLRAEWLRCGGTWLVGVNALPNDGRGVVGGSGPLAGQAVRFLEQLFKGRIPPFDRGQISVCYRGYPKPCDQESEANHRFRRDRDSAHIDGLQALGPARRRHLDERHAFILGIPLVETPPKAAPFVVWQGSHRIIQRAFARAFAGIEGEDWPEVDVTEIYQQARREVWASCERIEIPARVGEAYVVHRLALHGMAPWAEQLDGPAEGRAILYFRPDSLDSPSDWLLRD